MENEELDLDCKPKIRIGSYWRYRSTQAMYKVTEIDALNIVSFEATATVFDTKMPMDVFLKMFRHDHNPKTEIGGRRKENG